MALHRKDFHQLDSDDPVPVENSLPKNFLQQLIQARVAHGLTRKQLALKLAITESLMSDIENGKHKPIGALLAKIRKALAI